jgi:hypothetical protein
MAKAVTNSLTKKRRRVSDIVLKALIFLSSGIVVALTLGMIIYIAVKGTEGISLNFLTTPAFSYPYENYGVLGNIINTLYLVVITLIIATPVGVGAAIYLTEYAKQSRLTRIYYRNACRHPLNHIRTFRQRVLLQYLQGELLTAYRCADIVNNGTAHHNPYHAGGDKDRSYGLQRGCCRTGRT